MRTNIRVLKLFGIPVEVNLSWFITLAFVTTMLALRFYPEVLPRSREQDYVLHWIMGLVSGIVFFGSIILHELAHSLVARKQGLDVKSITLFIFGGVSQIAGEARRPLHEFIMAIVGPLTSLILAGLFFAVWSLAGPSRSDPLSLVLEWLTIMNLVLAVFNMAPGFPMDGGRVLRSVIWGVSGNLHVATRLATFVGRSLGFGLILVGGLAFMGVLRDFVDPISGLWFVLLGLFLESSSRQSWFQAKAMHLLSGYKASDVMNKDLLTAYGSDLVRYLRQRAGRYFIFFVVDEADDQVVGVVTEKEADTIPVADLARTAAQIMIPKTSALTVAPEEDGASILRQMETESVWHLPVLEDGRVIGVVSKESLLRLLAQNMFRTPRLSPTP